MHQAPSTRTHTINRSESSSEYRTMNYLINQYLLSNNYKLTSITFTEENESIDRDNWDDMARENVSLPDLIHLYRWYCYQLHASAQHPKRIDASVCVNMDANLADDYRRLQTLFQQIVCLTFAIARFSALIYIRIFSKLSWLNRVNAMNSTKTRSNSWTKRYRR